MDFANRGNRPSNDSQGQPAPAFQPAGKKGKSNDKFGLGHLGGVLVIFSVAVLLIALVVGLIFVDGNKESDLIDETAYQAVFLDSADGQVYFGNLAVYNEDLYVLTDIYYVRVEQPIQPQGQGQQAAQPNISLAKLGNELHGPEDVMHISRNKVLYWENLKDDGQVVQAITEFVANGGEEGQQQQQQQQQPAQQQTQPQGTPAEDDTSGTEAPAEQ